MIPHHLFHSLIRDLVCVECENIMDTSNLENSLYKTQKYKKALGWFQFQEDRCDDLRQMLCVNPKEYTVIYKTRQNETQSKEKHKGVPRHI